MGLEGKCGTIPMALGVKHKIWGQRWEGQVSMLGVLYITSSRG